VIAGLLTIPVIYKITYKLSNSYKLSLFAAFLSSIDYWLVYYSLEVRPYSFIIFFSAIHIYIFIFFLEKKNKLFYASILGTISGVIILLNYTSATLCVFEFFVAIAYFSKCKKFSKVTFYGLLIYTILPIFILLPFTHHITYLIQNKSLLGSFIKKTNIASIFFIYPHFINYILLP